MRTSLVIPLLAAAAVRGANDWKVKCSGACEWETNSAPGQPFATVAIDGPSRVVSDITPAASWEILDCPANWDAGSREVRLVCTADDPAAGGCDDLLEDGAVDTIVRLPASCGTGPFARVAVWGVSGDQSIPEGSVAQRKLKLRKRAEPAQVMQATLDWDLKAIPEQRGTVTIDVRGGSLPSTGATASRMRNKMKRQFGFLDDIGNAIGDAADSVGDFVGDAVDTVEEVATDVGEAIGDTAQDVVDGAQEAVENVGEFVGDAADTVGDAVGDAVDAVGDFVEDVNNVDINDSTSTNISIVDTFQLLTTSLTCSAGPASFDATVTVSVDVDVQANIGFAFLMKATVAPPDVQDFAIAGVMSGRAKAVFNIEAFLAGDIDSGFLPIVNLGIPGLSIPGVFNLGPQVAINARAFATLDFATSMTIPTTWNFPLIDFALPDSKGTAEAESEESKNTSDIQFSMNPGELNGQIEAHIIPGLEFGIDVLNGFVAGAEVFMRADADATLKLEATVNPDFSMDGCTDLSVGINVNAGATASFLSFFNEQTSITIFQKRAEIFKRCFGAGDGPATAIFDNGDGTFTNALGDLVNENGELIDEAGNVIPDSEALPIGEEGAAAEDPNAPVLDEAGNPIPEEDLIFDNGDGTFEDAAGNPTNEFGQRIDSLGGLLACELDLTGAVDEDGTPIAPEDVIVENSDGTFSNGNCDIVNAEGQKVDAAGNVIDFEPVLDENGVEIPPEDIIIDNGDGTFSDINGNPVDEFGGAIDIDAEGNVIPVELEPFPEDVAPVEDVEQIEEEPLITEDPELVIKTEDEVKQIAIDLVNGVFAPQRRFAARSSVPPKPVVAKRNSTKPNTEMKKRQGGLACFPSVSGPGIPPIPTSPLDLARFF